MADRDFITHSDILNLFIYEPNTGLFRWRVNRCKGRAGNIAGGAQKFKSGAVYWRIRFNLRDQRFIFHAQRLAVFYMTGAWPPYEADHRNNDTLDNRWTNIRVATRAQNSQNCRQIIPNMAGFKGVSVHRDGRPKPFFARITVNCKGVHLGSFHTSKEAHEAYKKAAKKYYGEFANFG